MFSRSKIHSFQLLQGFSHSLHLKLPFAFLIELLSCLQTLSVVVWPTMFNTEKTTQDNLSRALNGLFSYMKPFELFDPFMNEACAIIVMSLCGIYFACFTGAIVYMFHHIQAGSGINSRSKKLSFCGLLHSKVIFYLVHCFLVKTLDYNFGIENRFFETKSAWILVSIVLLIFNVGLAAIKELFCFQAHQDKDTFGIKDNLYGLNILAHKTIAVILYYFLEDPTDALVIINILFATINLTTLHLKLTFYDLRMLKLSIIMSTIATWTSLLSIARILKHDNPKLLILILATMGFAIKLSLIRLNWTILDTLNLENLTPSRIAHLPTLIQEYEKKIAITPTMDKTNRETLYSMGFSTASRAFGNSSSFDSEEMHNHSYAVIIKEMLRLHQRTRHNKDGRELLPLCIAQIYIQVFADSFKAMLILSKLTEKNMSIVNRISLKALQVDLENLNYKFATDDEGKNSSSTPSNVDYFVYKLKSQRLKEYIKEEIAEHQAFWKFISLNIIQAMPVIKQGNKISRATLKTNQYWHNNFENLEHLYVNAAIMYGLYLKIIQSLPSAGSALVRKAFSSLNNMQHRYKDVIDIVLGNKAVLIASIEPDKIGKIVDTSSSVNKMFQVHKRSLIGSNVAMLMPGMIASEHNDLIKRYHKQSKQKLNRVIKSYAKTLTDEFFSVDMVVQLSPYTKNGLNVIACLEKTSGYEPIMIVDSDGNIIECSKDLTQVLGITTKKSSLKVESLCKELREVNHAFNMIYTPTASEIFAEKEKEQIHTQGDLMFEDYLKGNSGTRKAVTNDNNKETVVSPRSTRRLLLNSMENDNAGLTSSDRGDNLNNLFFETERVLPLPLRISMGREEAEKICHDFRYGKETSFSLPKSSKKDSFKCNTEIEPLIFQNKLYKIFKLKDLNTSLLIQQQKTSFSLVPSTAIKLQKEASATTQNEDPDGDKFADAFPDDIERGNSPRSKFHKCSIEPFFELKPLKMIKDTSHVSTNLTKPIESKEQAPLSETFNSKKSKKKTYRAQSLVTSQFSQEVAVTQLSTSLKIERQSPQIRLAVNMVYLAVIIILCSIYVDLSYMKKSLAYMSNSMDLIGLVNDRMGKALLAWQGVLALYSRSTGFRKIDAKFAMNKVTAINYTMGMLTNGQQLLQKVDELGDKEISEIFYRKSLALWEPKTQTLFNNEKIDGFSAEQMITELNLNFANYNGTFTDLNGTRDPLFTINNTANAYILSLEETISEVSLFFENTRKNNISLLKVIVTLECLFIVIPCALTIYILVTTVNLYKKLFQALCKIHLDSLNWRLKQMEHIAALFEESIEDDISYFNEYKERINMRQQAVETTKKVAHSSKIYQDKSLILFGLKYILIAVVLTGVLIGLVGNSFTVSNQSFSELDTINNQLLASFALNSRVKLVTPSFYFVALFLNDTSYKIRDRDPRTQFIDSIDAVGNSNEDLLAAVSNSDNKVDDPVINQILRGKVCDFLTPVYYTSCVQNTNGESFGLLGLQPKFYQLMNLFKSWAISSSTLTLDSASTVLTQVSSVINNLYFVIYDLYDYLANHLIDTFVQRAEEQKNQAVKLFYINVVVTLLTMILIRMIVLKKLRALDIGIRRILRIIPYKIIEENKVMSFYLVKTFGKEVDILKRLVN